MAINQYLDLSTGHITDRTCNVWASRNPYPVVATYPCGVIVAVPSELPEQHPDTPRNIMIPEDLKRVIEYARSKGCALIRFDSDGDFIDELPSYDW